MVKVKENLMAKFKIITDSCSELDAEMRKKYNVDYYPMGLIVDEHDTIADLDWGEYSIEEFYQLLKDHHHVKTSLISVPTVIEVSTKYLKDLF